MQNLRLVMKVLLIQSWKTDLVGQRPPENCVTVEVSEVIKMWDEGEVKYELKGKANHNTNTAPYVKDISHFLSQYFFTLSTKCQFPTSQ